MELMKKFSADLLFMDRSEETGNDRPSFVILLRTGFLR